MSSKKLLTLDELKAYGKVNPVITHFLKEREAGNITLEEALIQMVCHVSNGNALLSQKIVMNELEKKKQPGKFIGFGLAKMVI